MNFSQEAGDNWTSQSICNEPFAPCFQYFLHNYHYDNFLLSFVIINALVAVTASCFNCIVIYTISSKSSLQTPSNVLILGLAISDLGVGIVSQPLYCLYIYAQSKRDQELFSSTRMLYIPCMTALSVISLLTLSLITADRYLAVYLHLRYNELVTKKRYGIYLTSIWLLSIINSVARMLNVDKAFVFLVVGVILIFGILVTDFTLIFKIWRVIRRHSRQIQAQQQSVQQPEQCINMPRYKKSVHTMYVVIGAFILSYIPLFISLVTRAFFSTWTKVLSCLFVICETLVMFNGVLNPIIYCWRITEIRTTTRQIMRQICKR